MLQIFNAFLTEDEGQDLTEYALLLALIAIVCVLAVQTLGGTVKGVFEKTNTELSK